MQLLALGALCRTVWANMTDKSIKYVLMHLLALGAL